MFNNNYPVLKTVAKNEFNLRLYPNGVIYGKLLITEKIEMPYLEFLELSKAYPENFISYMDYKEMTKI